MATQETSRPAPKHRHHHLELLAALVGLLVVQSFLSPEEKIQRAVLNGVLLLVVLSAIRALSASKIRLWLTLGLGGIAYVLSWADEVHHAWGLVAVIDVCFIAIFSLLISALAENVFGEGPIDANRIVGAVSIFFLFGLAWAFIYALIELIHPGSFKFSSAVVDTTAYPGFVSEFIYFSNVTLTTLGYGDVVPLSPPARIFASLQAMTGQLYIAIVIARLVGLHVSQSRDVSPNS